MESILVMLKQEMVTDFGGRKDNKRLTRKTQCHSKKGIFHDAQIDFITAVYNFVDEASAFRECINPNAKPFETKYRKVTPAMVEGIIERKLSLEELLMMKPIYTQ